MYGFVGVIYYVVAIIFGSFLYTVTNMFVYRLGAIEAGLFCMVYGVSVRKLKPKFMGLFFDVKKEESNCCDNQAK